MQKTWSLVVLATLVGCVELDVTEEVWIESDGRVRVRLETQMRAPFPPPAERGSGMLARDESRLRAVPGARVTRRVERLPDGRREVLEAELPGLPASLEAGSRVALLDLGGGRRRFVSRIEPKRSGTRREPDPVAELLAAKLLAGSTYRLVLHAPRVTSSDGQVTGDAVVWERPILELAEGFSAEAELELPDTSGSSALVLGLVGLVILAGGATLLAVRRLA